MRSIGDKFEQHACDQLERAGLKLLARNYSTRFGELDLIMREGDTIVFVEVRYRKHANHGTAAESVTLGKRAKLLKAAELWLAEHGKNSHLACRFDVVTYDGSAGGAQFGWIRDAIQS